MSKLFRRVLQLQSRRFSVTIICRGKRESNLEMEDAMVDEQFHLMPLGKSDMGLQTRVSFASADMAVDQMTCILSISSYGFRMKTGDFMFGAIAAFPKTVLSWRVATVDEIIPESIDLFLLLQPKLDILIIGAGDKKDIDKVHARLAPTLKANKIPYEILSTEFAIPTFNFLNNDGRFVAAALFPPQDIAINNYEHGKAMQMVRGWDENEFSPLLLGYNLDGDKDNNMISLFYEGEPAEEREKGRKRILALRDQNREERQKYFELRRERAEEEHMLSLQEAKQNLRDLLAKRAAEEEEQKKSAKSPKSNESSEQDKKKPDS